MIKKFLFSVLVISAMVLTGCGPSLKVTGSWINPALTPGQKNYNKIFLLVLSSNLSARQTVEDAQAKALAAEGVETVKSYMMITPDMVNRGVDKEMVLSLVEQSGCDAIFTSALIDAKSETRYVPGSTYYQPYPSYGYYGNFGSYYHYSGSYVYDPGYYVEDQTYYIESNLYDFATGEIMWSVQSESYNPSNLKSMAQTYNAVLIDKIKKEGFLKKQ